MYEEAADSRCFLDALLHDPILFQNVSELNDFGPFMSLRNCSSKLTFIIGLMVG